MNLTQELTTGFFGGLAAGLLLRELILAVERSKYHAVLSTSEWLKLMRKHSIGTKPKVQDAHDILNAQVEREIEVISVERISK